ncbi:MAG: hypothetical protein NUV93_04030, partial [Firmicutes bacterium]|nr:hypothetical protein [Bacillota bacterium]
GWCDSLLDDLPAGGYDIALANPPYVRQELLSPDLKYALRKKYPGFSARSDLYVYFFAMLDRILAPGGVASVICPTSWMEVGYGSELSDFLASRFDSVCVIRSAVERWFEGACVDAAVVLLVKPGNSCERKPPRRRVRLVTLGSPLDETPWDALLKELDPDTPPVRASSGTVTVKTIAPAASTGRKWGTSFGDDPLESVFAPVRERLCRLKEIAAVKRGFTTGANAFFYVRVRRENLDGLVEVESSARPGQVAHLPPEVLLPVVRSPREIKGYKVREELLRYRVLAAGAARFVGAGVALGTLPGGLDEFIRWGVAHGYHLRPTCAARSPWWALGRQPIAPILWPMTVRKRFFAAMNRAASIDARLYGIYPIEGIDPLLLGAILNSSVTWLQAEHACRRYGGGGGPVDMKVYEVAEFLVPDPRRMAPGARAAMADCFAAMLGRDVLPVDLEVNLPDRAALDGAVLASLGLDDREAESAGARVREALVQRVEERTRRAKRVMGRGPSPRTAGAEGETTLV